MEKPREPRRRFVDREEGRIFTNASEKELRARGFEYVGTQLNDGSLPDRGSLMGYNQKADEYQFSQTGAGKKSPAASIKEKVEQERRAGYDIRIIRVPASTRHQTDQFRIFRRLDLDRFITRTPKEYMGIEEYSLETSRFILHGWGDEYQPPTKEAHRSHLADMRRITDYIKGREDQNYEVRFIEKDEGMHHVLFPFSRPKRREHRPLFEAHRPLTGISNEQRNVLMGRGFVCIEENGNDDASLNEKSTTITIDPKGESPETITLPLPVGLDSAYFAAIENLTKNGIPPSLKNPKEPRTIREKIIAAASRGHEIRAVRSQNNPRRLSLFRRFDLARFIEPPETTPLDLITDGFEFYQTLPLTAWGDAGKEQYSVATKAHHAKLENTIQVAENKGYQIRCVVGTFYPSTGVYEPVRPHLTLFARKKEPYKEAL